VHSGLVDELRLQQTRFGVQEPRTPADRVIA